MRKTKAIIAIMLAIVLAISVLAVPASAAEQNSESLPSKVVQYMSFEAWTLTHLKEVTAIAKDLANGKTDALEQYIPDPEQQAYFLKVSSFSATAGYIDKAIQITFDPLNSEKWTVPVCREKQSGKKRELAARTNSPINQRFTLLSTRGTPHEKITLEPYFVYKSSNDELVFLGILGNDSHEKVEVAGIPSIDITVDGKPLASAEFMNFDSPMKFSSPDNSSLTGVNDGLPTECLIIIIFEPGSYDSSFDISQLDHLNTAYTLDYTVLE